MPRSAPSLTTHPPAVILPEVISKEPLGPVVRQGDDEFFNLVKWVLYAMINAEELGVTSQNIAGLRADPNAPPAVKRLVGSGRVNVQAHQRKTG